MAKKKKTKKSAANGAGKVMAAAGRAKARTDAAKRKAGKTRITKKVSRRR